MRLGEYKTYTWEFCVPGDMPDDDSVYVRPARSFRKQEDAEADMEKWAAKFEGVYAKIVKAFL